MLWASLLLSAVFGIELVILKTSSVALKLLLNFMSTSGLKGFVFSGIFAFSLIALKPKSVTSKTG